MLEVDFSFIERGDIKLKSIFHHKTFLHKKLAQKNLKAIDKKQIVALVISKTTFSYKK